MTLTTIIIGWFLLTIGVSVLANWYDHKFGWSSKIDSKRKWHALLH